MKTVLVTGGGGEIGSAICREFAANGYAVIATYRSNRAKAQSMLQSLEGNHHQIFEAPTTHPEAIAALIKQVEEFYGKLNVLVNNAGVTTPVAHDDLEGLSDAWIDRIFETNFRGAFAMARACKALLEKASETDGPALIVNISSVAGQSGIGSNVAYCASKAAVDSMTRSLGRALAPNIRVVSVAPGWVLGDYTKEIDPTYLKAQQDATPLARLARAADVAQTVFAVSEHITFTTGSIIPVDGGRLLGN